ncbi:hypothetical protein JN531_017180 (plasmid) [Flagellatimonas centrodinii]|uniref:hypothetical protein n=1 Tax=Flagellatimonas centrodinii TaxID=2806210 RepID=UPI001FED6577|nr:hypothetical protein [Flagellatimonas centrodinii]ULQ48366.1 hypothetical protein JN531_017180 [Flagellatimonas centrodinii]
MNTASFSSPLVASLAGLSALSAAIPSLDRLIQDIEAAQAETSDVDLGLSELLAYAHTVRARALKLLPDDDLALGLGSPQPLEAVHFPPIGGFGASDWKVAS